MFSGACLLTLVNLCAAVYVNPGQRVFLNGHATRIGPSSAVQNVSWTVVSGDIALESSTVNSPKSPTLGIKENALLPGHTYVFRFAGRYDNGLDVEDDVVFSTYGAPSGGTVSVTPSSGLVGSTEFALSTSGWASGDGSAHPLKYRFSYRTNQSNFEVPLTAFSVHATDNEIVFEPLHVFGVEVTVLVRAMNSLGVVSDPVSSSPVTLSPNPSLSSSTPGLLERWRLAVEAQNLTSILRAGCLLSAVVADTNSTSYHNETEAVLNSISESLSNFTTVSSLTPDVADLASHALAQTTMALVRNDSLHVSAALAVLDQLTAAAAVDPQVVTDNGTISQASVISAEFSHNALQTMRSIMTALDEDLLADRAVDVAVGTALDAIADRHLVGRLCGETLVLSGDETVQLMAGITPGDDLSTVSLDLPGGSWSLPEGFFAAIQRPFNRSCVPIRAYVLPVNIQAPTTVTFMYNSTSPPALSQPGSDMGLDQQALFDPKRNVGFQENSPVHYIRFGDDDTGIDGVTFNFSGGMVVTFQLPSPVLGESVRCAYKENILDAWQSDDTCQLTFLNDTHGQCTCYHASAIVIQSAPVCQPKNCWDIFLNAFEDCSGSYASWADLTDNHFCFNAYDGCGGTITCGSCNYGQVPTEACTPGYGCVNFTHPAAIALAQEQCKDQCGFVMFPYAGSTVCTCQAGFDCVNGVCKASPTCAELNKTCGVWPNGQGGVVGPCGNCSSGQTCNASGQCAAAPPPPPCSPITTCPTSRCGKYPDGCGGHLNCGSCPGSQRCNDTSNYCVKGCRTCWDVWNGYILSDYVPCIYNNVPLQLLQDMTCDVFQDDCGGALLCGWCWGLVNGHPQFVSDCVPGGGGMCVAQPYNHTYYSTGSLCTQNCNGRCGYTMFNNCGSKVCTCPAGQVCSNGWCAVVQTQGANWAASFDGALGYWTGWNVASTATQNMSLSMWVYPNGVKTKDQYIFYNGVATLNGWGLKIPANYPMNVSVLLGGTGAPPSQAPFKYSLPIKVWTYITVICTNGSDWFIYANATQMGSFTLSSRVVTPASKFTVGGSFAANQNGNFDGRVDSVQLWEYALSTDEITTNFLNGVSGFEPGLAMYLPFNEATGTSTSLVGTGAALNIRVNITGTTVGWSLRANNTNGTWASSGGVNKRAVLPEKEGAVKQIDVPQPVEKSVASLPLFPQLAVDAVAAGSLAAVVVVIATALVAFRFRAAAPVGEAPSAGESVSSSLAAGEVALKRSNSSSSKSRSLDAAGTESPKSGKFRPPASPMSPDTQKTVAPVVRDRAELNKSPRSRKHGSSADVAKSVLFADSNHVAEVEDYSETDEEERTARVHNIKLPASKQLPASSPSQYALRRSTSHPSND